MSTLKATNLSHPSAASPNVVMGSTGSVAVAGALTGAGMDLITASTFSAAASVSVNGCFTSAYENYVINVNYTGASASDPLIFFRLRSAGSDNSSNYLSNAILQYGSTVAGNTNYGGDATKWSIGKSANLYPAQSIAKMEIYNAGSANYTNFVGRALWTDSAGQPIQLVTSGRHEVSAAYDGFSLIASTGTITGTIRVYGLRNS